MLVYKKGQGLSLNVVILAILAIVVLAILTFFLTTQAGEFQAKKESCIGKGGVCLPDDISDDDSRIPDGFKNVGSKYNCKPQEGYECYVSSIIS